MQSHAFSCSVLHRRPRLLRVYQAFSAQTQLRGSARTQKARKRCSQRVSAVAGVEVAEDVKQSPEAQSPAAAAPSPQEDKDWAAVVDALKHGTLLQLDITVANKGGVRGNLHGITGVEAFLPYSKMWNDSMGAHPTRKSLVGSTVEVMVVSAEAGEQRRCVLSVKAVSQAKALRKYKRGDLVDVLVTGFAPFGAFATIKDAETGTFIGGKGLLHISDLSYDHVAVPEDKLTVGETVQCKIKSVDKAKQRIGLSLKLMENDPLTETLDTMLPPELRDQAVQVPVNIPQGVKDICAELQQEDGIDSVFLGRQVEERRVVSQDLELWISKEVLEDGYNLVTRAGRTVQELKVTTTLPIEDMKSAISRVLQRIG